jgi:hypothetical protein
MPSEGGEGSTPAVTHLLRGSEMMRWAQDETWQLQQPAWSKLRYSITTSAVESSVDGAARLSALAVLRIIRQSVRTPSTPPR